MASFTDAISQFNPYIKQLPVEEMLKVGVYKQQKYDEGIQKIQGYVDNIAGMDVIKPIHKQYLQSKLNELGSNLKTVAAGDFSNYQLVNSVGGMATQIVKDPTVQSALVSTQRVRKGQEEMETARKAGKSSIQNEGWWSKTLNDWMDDGDMKSQFNGRYVEYRDMEAKLREVADKVHEYDQSVEIPYVRDNSGSVLYFDANGNVTTQDRGKPRIDDAILKTRVKGKSAEKILNNFYTSLDENDMQQLKIDGWYHYKGYTGESFKKKIIGDITDLYNIKKKNISEEVVTLTTELATNNKLTAEQKNAIQSKLNKYNSYIKDGELDKEMQTRLSNIATSDELGLKQSIYTEKFLSRLANDISYQTIETEFKESPQFNALMKRKDLEFKYWDATERFKRDDRDYLLNKRKIDWDIQKDILGKADQNITFEDLGVRTEGKILPTMETAAKDIVGVNDEMERVRKEVAPSLIANYDDLSEPERRAAMNNIINKYIANPNNITDDNDVRRKLEEYRSLSNELTRKQSNYVEISKKSAKFDKALEDLISNQKPVVDQRGVAHRPSEIIKVLKDVDDKTQLVKKWSPSEKAYTYEADQSKALAAYKGTKYEGIVNAYINRTSNQTFSQDSKSAAVGKQVSDIINLYGQKSKEFLDQKKKFQSEELAKTMPQYQMAVGALNMKDEPTAQRVDKIMSEMYSIYNEQGRLDTENFNPSTISSWKEDNKDLRYVIKKSADNTVGSLQIFNGTEMQEIPLDRRRLAKYFPTAAGGHPLESVNYMVASSTNKTTNAMNIRGSVNVPEAAVNAAFSGEQLGLLSGTVIAPQIRFDIEGAMDNSGNTETDGYQLRMYVNDNGVWKSKVVNNQGYTSLNGIYQLMQNIGTKQYEEVKLYGK